MSIIYNTDKHSQTLCNLHLIRMREKKSGCLIHGFNKRNLEWAKILQTCTCFPVFPWGKCANSCMLYGFNRILFLFYKQI